MLLEVMTLVALDDGRVVNWDPLLVLRTLFAFVRVGEVERFVVSIRHFVLS